MKTNQSHSHKTCIATTNGVLIQASWIRRCHPRACRNTRNTAAVKRFARSSDKIPKAIKAPRSPQFHGGSSGCKVVAAAKPSFTEPGSDDASVGGASASSFCQSRSCEPGLPDGGSEGIFEW